MTFKSTLNFSKDARIETLSNCLILAWANDHKIAIYRFAEHAQEQAADLWHQSVIRMLQTHTQGICFIHDFSGIQISDYYYRKIWDISEQSQAYRGRVVFVLQQDTSSQRRVDILRAFNYRRLPQWTVMNYMYSRFGAVDRSAHLDNVISAELEARPNHY